MNKQARFILVDTSSSKLRKINISFPKIFFIFLILASLIGLSLKISADMMINFNHNSRIAQLQQENATLAKRLDMMTEKISAIREHMDNIEVLDDQLRAQLDLPELDAGVRQVGIGGSDLTGMSSIEVGDAALGSVILNNQNLLNRLEREVKLELESYEKLLFTAERKEDSLRFLPAIKPVHNARLTDRFGKRKHPIFKRIMPHMGIDLAADRGTPVLATADGYVKYTGKNGGYGLFVSINHKYGFETKYGHMRKIYVRRGQFVKRGDKIGEVGNTGISTAPHLHYEVIYKGKAINPLDYYFPDLAFE